MDDLKKKHNDEQTGSTNQATPQAGSKDSKVSPEESGPIKITMNDAQAGGKNSMLNNDSAAEDNSTVTPFPHTPQTDIPLTQPTVFLNSNTDKENKRKRYMWAGLGLIALLLILPASVYLVQQNQNPNTEASWSGFFEGVHLCAEQRSKQGCPTDTVLLRENFETESTVRISGKIYRNSGDEQMNESVELLLNDTVLYTSEDRLGLPENHIEDYSIETTIQPSDYSFIAQHMDTSDNPQSAGSIGIDISIEIIDYTITCSEVLLYDENDLPLTFDQVYVGQTIQLAVKGETADPDGITKARFSTDGGNTWQETTNTNSEGEFLLLWTVPDEDSIEVLAQVYNPNLGWK